MSVSLTTDAPFCSLRSRSKHVSLKGKRLLKQVKTLHIVLEENSKKAGASSVPSLVEPTRRVPLLNFANWDMLAPAPNCVAVILDYSSKCDVSHEFIASSSNFILPSFPCLLLKIFLISS